MAIHPAFLGHGLYTQFSVRNALDHFAGYGDGAPATTPADKIKRFVSALQAMAISTVWIQLFSHSNPCDDDTEGKTIRQNLVDALTHNGIGWAGWGYTSAKSWQDDRTLIDGLYHSPLKLRTFVIDAEPGNYVCPDPKKPCKSKDKIKDIWDAGDFDTFTRYAHDTFGTDNLALSTWPMLQIQKDKDNPVVDLMKIAAPRVCLFAPQAYWMTYPTDVHYGTYGYSHDEFPPGDPASFVRMVQRAWIDDGFTKPLVITGQAYWGESAGTPEDLMTGKVKSFVGGYKGWNSILGFNWYHAGGGEEPPKGSMSKAMIDAVKKAQIGTGARSFMPPP